MSSIMKGIVDEGEEVAVLYIDGKASTKYANHHEAERDAARIREKFPNRKVEIKKEVRETEAIKGADGKRCWKGKRYAGTENGKDKCIPVKNEAAFEKDLADNEPRIVTGVYGAKSKEFRKKFANQNAQDRFFDHPDNEGNYEIHYVKKADISEGVIIGHDAKDPQVAVLGGAGSYTLSNLKKKALGEARQLAQDIENGEYKNSAYNVKQLANTLNTIVAAEEEMEKLYFGEGILDKFKKKVKKPELNLPRYPNSNDANEWMEAKADYYAQYEPGSLPNLFSPASGDYLPLTVHVGSSWKPENLKFYRELKKKYPEAIQQAKEMTTGIAGRVSLSRVGDDEDFHGMTISNEDYTGEFAAEKTAAINPYGGQKDRQFRGAIAEARAPHPMLKAINQNLMALASGEVRRREEAKKEAAKREREYAKQAARAAKPKKPTLDQIWQHVEHAISNYFPDGDPSDYLNPYMRKVGITWDDITRAAKKNGYKDLWDYWNTLAQDIENDAYGDWLATGGKNVRLRAPFMEEPDTSGAVGTQPGGWRRTDMEEDTAYAGGMGQGGNSGQSYRKFKPKSAGTYKESSIMKGITGRK